MYIYGHYIILVSESFLSLSQIVLAINVIHSVHEYRPVKWVGLDMGQLVFGPTDFKFGSLKLIP